MSDELVKKVNDLKVTELKAELEKRGLDKSGLKPALVKRLLTALKTQDTTLLTDVQDVPSPDMDASRSEDVKLTGSDQENSAQAVESGLITKADAEANITVVKNENTEDLVPHQNYDRNAEEEAGEDAMDLTVGEEDHVEDVDLTTEEDDQEDALNLTIGEEDRRFSMDEEDEVKLDSTGDDENEELDESDLLDPNDESIEEEAGDALLETHLEAEEDEAESVKEAEWENEPESEKIEAVKEAADPEETEDTTMQSGHTADDESLEAHKSATTEAPSASHNVSATSNDAKSSAQAKAPVTPAVLRDPNLDGRVLIVTGFSSETRAVEIKNLFQPMGKITGVKIISLANKFTGSSRFAQVTMFNSEDATQCLKLDNYKLHGQTLHVEKEKAKVVPTPISSKKQVSRPAAVDNVQSRKSTEVKLEVIPPSSAPSGQESDKGSKQPVSTDLDLAEKVGDGIPAKDVEALGKEAEKFRASSSKPKETEVVKPKKSSLKVTHEKEVSTKEVNMKDGKSKVSSAKEDKSHAPNVKDSRPKETNTKESTSKETNSKESKTKESSSKSAGSSKSSSKTKGEVKTSASSSAIEGLENVSNAGSEGKGSSSHRKDDTEKRRDKKAERPRPRPRGPGPVYYRKDMGMDHPYNRRSNSPRYRRFNRMSQTPSPPRGPPYTRPFSNALYGRSAPNAVQRYPTSPSGSSSFVYRNPRDRDEELRRQKREEERQRERERLEQMREKKELDKQKRDREVERRRLAEQEHRNKLAFQEIQKEKKRVQMEKEQLALLQEQILQAELKRQKEERERIVREQEEALRKKNELDRLAAQAQKRAYAEEYSRELARKKAHVEPRYVEAYSYDSKVDKNISRPSGDRYNSGGGGRDDVTYSRREPDRDREPIRSSSGDGRRDMERDSGRSNVESRREPPREFSRPSSDTRRERHKVHESLEADKSSRRKYTPVREVPAPARGKATHSSSDWDDQKRRVEVSRHGRVVPKSPPHTAGSDGRQATNGSMGVSPMKPPSALRDSRSSRVYSSGNDGAIASGSQIMRKNRHPRITWL